MTRNGMLNKDLHVYLSERDHRDLRAWADAECRSVNGQVLHIVRQALASRGVEVSESHDNLVERIRHATRSGLHHKGRAE